MDGKDLRIWSCCKDGCFSVASYFDAFSRVDLGASNIAKLWKFKARSRVLAFSWIALLGGTLTIDNLRRRKLCIVNACPMCLADEETVVTLSKIA